MEKNISAELSCRLDEYTSWSTLAESRITELDELNTSLQNKLAEAKAFPESSENREDESAGQNPDKLTTLEEELRASRESLESETLKSAELFAQLEEYSEWSVTAQARISELEELTLSLEGELDATNVKATEGPGNSISETEQGEPQLLEDPTEQPEGGNAWDFDEGDIPDMALGEQIGDATEREPAGSHTAVEQISERAKSTQELEEELRVVSEQLESAKSNCQELEENLETYSNWAEEAKSRLNDLESFNASLEIQISELKNDKESKMIAAPNTGSDNALKEIENELEATKSLLEVEQSYSLELVSQIEEMSESSKNSLGRISDLEKLNAELEKKMNPSGIEHIGERLTELVGSSPSVGETSVGGEDKNKTILALEDKLCAAMNTADLEKSNSEELLQKISDYAIWCETAQNRIEELEEDIRYASNTTDKQTDVTNERKHSTSSQDLGARFAEEALNDVQYERDHLKETLEDQMFAEKSRTKDLEQQLNELSSRINNLEEEKKSDSETIDSLRSQLNSLNADNDEKLEAIKAHLKADQAEIATSKSQTEMLEDLLLNATKALDAEKAISSELSKRFEDLLNDDDFIQRELNELRKEKFDSEELVKQLQEKVSELEANAALSDNRAVEVESELSVSMPEKKDLGELVRNLQEKINELETNAALLVKRTEEAEGKLCAFMSEKEGLGEEKTQELESLLEAEKLHSAELSQWCSAAQIRIDEMEEETISFEDKIKILESRIGDYVEWCSSAQSRMDEMEQDKNVDDDTVALLKSQLDDANAGVVCSEELRQQVEELQNSTKEANICINALKEEKKNDEETINLLQSKSNEDKLEAIKAHLKADQTEIATLVSQKEELENLLRTMREALEVEKATSFQLTQQVEDLFKEDDFIQSELNELRKEKSDAEEQVKHLQEKINELEATAASLGNRAVQIDMSEDKAQELESLYEAEKLNSADLSQRIEEFSEWCSSAQSRIDEMEQDKENDDSTIKLLQSQLDEKARNDSDLQSKLMNVEGVMQKFSLENKNLQKMLDDEIQKAKIQSEDLSRNFDSKLNEQKRDADEAISLWDTRYNAINKELLCSKDECNILTNEKEALSGKLNNVINDLQSAQERSQQLENDVQVSRQIVHELREEFNEMSEAFPFNETDEISAKATEMATQALKLQIAELRGNYRREREELICERECRLKADQEILQLKEKIDLLSESSVGFKDTQEQLKKARADAEDTIRVELTKEIDKLHQQLDHVMDELENSKVRERDVEERASSTNLKLQIAERELASIRSDWQYLNESAKRSKERQLEEASSLRRRINSLEKDYECVNRTRLEEIRSLKSELANTLMERDRALISVAESEAKAGLLTKLSNTTDETSVEFLVMEKAKLLSTISETRTTCERRVRESVSACAGAKDSELIVEREARKKAEILVTDLQGQLDESQRTVWELNDLQVQKRNDDEASDDRTNELLTLKNQVKDMELKCIELKEENKKLQENIKTVSNESHLVNGRLTDKCNRSDQRIKELEKLCMEHQVLAERRQLKAESLAAEVENLQLGYTKEKKPTDDIVSFEDDDFCVLTAEEMTDQVSRLTKAIQEDRECYRLLLVEHENLLSLVAQQDIEISCLKEALIFEAGQDAVDDAIKKAGENAISLFGEN